MHGTSPARSASYSVLRTTRELDSDGIVRQRPDPMLLLRFLADALSSGVSAAVTGASHPQQGLPGQVLVERVARLMLGNPLAMAQQCLQVSMLRLHLSVVDDERDRELRRLHPSMHGVLCPFDTPESVRTGLVRHLLPDAPLDADGMARSARGADSEPPAIGVPGRLLPFREQNDPVRVIIGAKNLRQDVPWGHGSSGRSISSGID